MSKAPERIWADPPTTFDGMDIWHEEPCDVGTEYVRADLYAALEAEIARLTAERDVAQAGAVKVKPLVWFEVEKSRYGGKYTADGYTIRYIEGLWLLDFAGQSKAIWRFPTLDAAQAAAQADYDARILAAIQPDPEAHQADLAKAFCMGRDAAAAIPADHAEYARKRLGATTNPQYASDWSIIVSRCDMIVDAIRALTPPADLAAKIGGE